MFRQGVLVDLGRRSAPFVMAGFLVLLRPAAAQACSPPFEEPTIRALGPAQVVVVGTIGERVQGGRAFHVERWFNGGPPTTPLLIAFKEGEPVGDCSYLITTGASLIIAPYRDDGGGLYADLGTLQADPATGLGQKYVAEAISLFGPGVVPRASPAPDAPTPVASPNIGAVVAGLGLTVVLVFGGAVLLARRQRRSA